MTSSAYPWYLNCAGVDAYNDELADVVCLDFETTNLEKGDPRVEDNALVLASIKCGSGPVVTFEGPGAVCDELQRLVAKGKPTILVAHNAKFELGWMLRSGIPIHSLLPWDTMIAEYVIAGNRRVELGLGAVGRRYGYGGKDPIVDGMISGGVCPSEIPRQWLIERCERDVETTYAVYRAQRKLLYPKPLGAVLFTRCITTPVLAEIEREGMTLDPERVQAEYTKQTEAKLAALQELTLMTGGINLNSRPQLAEFLYGKLKFEEKTNYRGEVVRTATDKPMTDSDTLVSLKASTKQQKDFIKAYGRFGAASAALSKSLEFFHAVVEVHGGSFYGQFNQCVTQTHRLSSSGRKLLCPDGKMRGAQFQNMPRDYKRLFRPKKAGDSFLEIDGAQLEFRVAGHLGEDRQVFADALSGADIHRFTASVLSRKPESEITKEQRTAAKSETFKPMYGGESGTARQKAYYAAFREKYSGVYNAQQGWVASVLKDKQLVTPWGLVFYWPDTTMDSRGYVRNKANIFNYPIQSFATADIIPVSLVLSFWRCREQGINVRFVNTVHDSVCIEAAPEELDKLRKTLLVSWLRDTYRYLDRVYGIEMRVPLGVGLTTGRHWGEGEESAYSETYKRTTFDD